MGERTAAIRQEIDETRDSMTDKVAEIESQVYGTVDSLKENAQQRVDQVKERLNLQRMVDERPWTMLGAAMLTGFVLGSLGGGHEEEDYDRDYDRDYRYRDYRTLHRPQRMYGGEDLDFDVSDYERARRRNEARHQYRYYDDDMPRRRREESRREDYDRGEEHRQQRSRTSKIAAGLRSEFGGEFDAMKGAAVAAIVSTARELLTENVPHFKEELQKAHREREQQYREGQDFQRTRLSSDTPTDITAPAASRRNEEQTTYRHSHQENDVSSSINAPAIEENREREHGR